VRQLVSFFLTLGGKTAVPYSEPEEVLDGDDSRFLGGK
jgi:hypothetical protein